MRISDHACVYRGHVFHRRVRPVEHRLKYRVFSFYLDIDQLAALDLSLKLFSFNRWNLFPLFHKDLGDGRDAPLRQYVEDTLVQWGIEEVPAKVWVLCYPRILGYSFNPLVVFYCEREDQSLFAVLHEVHNTFGERQTYALPVNDAIAAEGMCSSVREKSADSLYTQHCDKRLYVSPFTPEKMHYSFRLNQPQDSLSLTIQAADEEGPMLVASVAGQRCSLTDGKLISLLFSYPFMTLKVIFAIHWEALQLWIKRVPWFKHKSASGPVH